jgi:hypothetical protein
MNIFVLYRQLQIAFDFSFLIRSLLALENGIKPIFWTRQDRPYLLPDVDYISLPHQKSIFMHRKLDLNEKKSE